MMMLPKAKRIFSEVLFLSVISLAAACGETSHEGFPMDPKAFQEKYNIQLGWLPSIILDYDKESKQSGYTDDGNTKWIIVSADKNAVVVNEVEWISDGNEPNGFRIEDKSAETKTYSLGNNPGVWLMIESAPLYKIPVSDLATLIQTDSGKAALWNYKLDHGKVVLLVQQFVP